MIAGSLEACFRNDDAGGVAAPLRSATREDLGDLSMTNTEVCRAGW